MKKALTIRIYPSKEQEILMRKHIGCMRFIYNWGLALNKEAYEKGEKHLSASKLGTRMTGFKTEVGYEWLQEVSNATLKEGLRNLDKAYTKFFKQQAGYPRFKSKKKSEISFYSRYEKVYFKNGLVNLEKIGKVPYKFNDKRYKHLDLEALTKFSNPSVSYNGRCWVLRVGIDQEVVKQQLSDVIIGIDLGIKDLAITNLEHLKAPNINKGLVIRKLEKKLKRLQRQVSRKYRMNKQGEKYIKTSNIRELEKRIKRLHTRLKQIRLEQKHQFTNAVVKTKPRAVVMEDLKVKNMMKNKHLAKAIGEQGFYQLITIMKYKCALNGIPFFQAPTFYPSSKTCSCCGFVHKGLKLKDRMFVCPECSYTIDRDYNASINLSNYGLGLLKK